MSIIVRRLEVGPLTEIVQLGRSFISLLPCLLTLRMLYDWCTLAQVALAEVRDRHLVIIFIQVSLIIERRIIVLVILSNDDLSRLSLVQH